MEKYLYLSLIPESLIASQLPPEEFGNYYAVGTRKRSRGQAVFFEVEPGFPSDGFSWEIMEQRTVPHEDGRLKRSVYLGVYRVLERVPLEALKKLYLVTDDGRVLALDKAPYVPDQLHSLHLYQEFCPMTPRVVSNLAPLEFCKQITNLANSVSVPKIVFSELELDKLARDPDSSDIGDLPYRNIGHLRDCLRELQAKQDKTNKQVDRALSGQVLFRTIKNGFFIGDGQEMLYYPLPPREQLEREYFEWWRSALTTFID
jgi:hypothetical protein